MDGLWLMENPIEVDDLGVPLFKEPPTWMHQLFDMDMEVLLGWYGWIMRNDDEDVEL